MALACIQDYLESSHNWAQQQLIKVFFYILKVKILFFIFKQPGSY